MNKPSTSSTHQVWIAHPASIAPDVLIQRGLALLDDEETARYRRFHFEKDRHHYLAAHILLRHALSSRSDIPPAQWRFIKGPQGKPSIDPASGDAGLQFNLSHTQGLVACIVTNGSACGIDVEVIRPLDDMQGVAGHVFSKEENDWLARHAAGAVMERAFFKLWTLKESYIKATGKGMSHALTEISFDPDQAPLVVRAGADIDRRWRFHLDETRASHMLAVAIDAAAPAASIELVELDFTAPSLQ